MRECAPQRDQTIMTDMTNSTDFEELAADGSRAGIEREEEVEFQDPFDPASISIETKIVSMDALIRRLKQGTIRLAPDFQRGFVWDDKRQSRLIESLMLRIPLPMFYVSADTEGNWDVVDGLQRLTTIRNFLLGPQMDEVGFKLTGLEFWGKRFDKKTFDSISSDPKNARIVNNIMETEMRFTVINPKTPEDVKFNVFKRINTGGMPLTNQEIRHALYQGEGTATLVRLVKTEEFTRATSNSIDDTRMAGRELITRFFAFTLTPWKKYNGDIDALLASTLKFMNNIPEEPLLTTWTAKKLEARFKLSMERCYRLFGVHAFRKSVPGWRRTPVNKALFDAWGNIIADLSAEEFKNLHIRKDKLIASYRELLKEDEFESAISRDALRASGVRHRFRSIQDLIVKTIDDTE
jgi:hypothetical protein